MLLNVDELLAFGQLYLLEGNWNGEQIIPCGWIREASSLHALRKAEHSMQNVTVQQATTIGAGYGYQIWLGPEAKWYYFIGSYDTIVLVLPQKNAVIAVAAHEVDKEGETLKTLVKTVLPEL